MGVTKITDRARAVDQWLIRALAIAGIPIACVLHGYVGFLFGAVKANPWWSSSLMPVIFLISAIVSGIATLVLLYLFICRRRGVTPDADCIRALSRYLWMFLVLAVALEGLELLQMAYESGGEWRVISALLTDHLAVSYGVVQVLIGAVVPLFILLVAFNSRFPPRLLSVVCGLGVRTRLAASVCHALERRRGWAVVFQEFSRIRRVPSALVWPRGNDCRSPWFSRFRCWRFGSPVGSSHFGKKLKLDRLR